MVNEYTYYLLNVFSDEGLIGGNQLAVIPNGTGLTDDQMLNITRQFNYSETTFVFRKDEKSADVRIFTPGKEIAYAGHPTVGTINTLETIWRDEGKTPRDQITINLKGGTLDGEINTENNSIGFVGFSQVLASQRGNFRDKSKIASLLGIDESKIVGDEYPIISVTSMKFLFVELKDPKSVMDVIPDLAGLVKPEFKDEDLCVFVYTKGGMDGGDFKTRFFVPLYGIPEDPATGGIQSSFCLALLKAGYLIDNSLNTIVVEQGYEVNRPSKIYNKVEIKDNEITKIITGGRCFHFANGTFKM